LFFVSCREQIAAARVILFGEEDRLCTYGVIARRILGTIVVVEKQ
jgi:hypothetical protein